jgi:hypothetical protein
MGNSIRKNKFLVKSILGSILLPLCLTGCGVKGKPLPPLSPPFIGNGPVTEGQEKK